MSGKNTTDVTIYQKMERLYIDIWMPIVLLSTWVGFGVGIMGELDDVALHRMNSPIKTFVNVIGHSFIGLTSGICWPIAMPILSMGALYNRSKRAP